MAALLALGGALLLGRRRLPRRSRLAPPRRPHRARALAGDRARGRPASGWSSRATPSRASPSSSPPRPPASRASSGSPRSTAASRSGRWASSRRSRPPSPVVPLARRRSPGRRARPRSSGSASRSCSPASSSSRESRRGRGRRPRRRRSRPGVVAALGFGLFFVGLDAGADESASWAVVAARATSVSSPSLAALVTARRSLRAPRAVLPMLVGDRRLRHAARTSSSPPRRTDGAAGIVAVLSSLYPVVTVVLAWIVLGERLSAPRRSAGASRSPEPRSSPPATSGW